MIELPVDLPSELVPLSWLVGEWEGTGVLDYAVGEERVLRQFTQRVEFSHDDLPHLAYNSVTWLEPETPDGERTPLVTETGYWRLSRTQGDADPGPGLLPGIGERPFTTAEAVETLRNDDGGFDIEVSLVHPGGVAELYLGQVKGPRIELTTDAVVRTAGAQPDAAATRMYGLVDNHLLWAWDIAALGQDLRTHASARLARVEPV
jgi:hypothetical protein